MSMSVSNKHLPLMINYDDDDDGQTPSHDDPQMMAKSSPGKQKGKTVQLADKGTTVAERCVWMTRTSDVLGSHIKTDLDSYMELIRRRIQEKCSTTVELITQIRRCKISDAAAVTPNEFRFTLIKFGITLDQSVVNRIFKIFDSDGSGTMDFDEFAMWIMNSEFRPKEKKKNLGHMDSPRSVMRKKLLQCVEQNPLLFERMPESISIIEFIAEINRKFMPISEREARLVFQILDKDDTGYVKSQVLMNYAKSGNSNYVEPPYRKPPIVAESLEELLHKIIGRNTFALETAFSHVEKGSGAKVPFDEFRRCLVNAGRGKNSADVRQAYNALGGKLYKGADIDLFFKALAPIIVDPHTAVSLKALTSPTISASRADRTLREAIRKAYKEVRNRILSADPLMTGFISSEKLYKIIVRKCTPMTLQDFRFITQHITKSTHSDDQTKIDYNQFLHSYNPKHITHQLDGLLHLKSSVNLHDIQEAAKTTLDTGRLSTAPQKATRRPSIIEEKALRPNTVGNSNSMRRTNSMSNSVSMRPNTDALKKIWHAVLRGCHRADPDQIGQVSKQEFIAAVEMADVTKSMELDQISTLADSYLLANGRINYLLCFRNYLSDLTQSSSTLSILANSTSTLKIPRILKDGEQYREGGVNHPWLYDYKREKHQEPYWAIGTSSPKREAKSPVKKIHLETIDTGSRNNFHTLLGRVKTELGGNYRNFKTACRRAQIKNQQGQILLAHFVNILASYNVKLRNDDLTAIVRIYRGKGLVDVVKFEGFFVELDQAEVQ